MSSRVQENSVGMEVIYTGAKDPFTSTSNTSEELVGDSPCETEENEKVQSEESENVGIVNEVDCLPRTLRRRVQRRMKKQELKMKKMEWKINRVKLKTEQILNDTCYIKVLSF